MVFGSRWGSVPQTLCLLFFCLACGSGEQEPLDGAPSGAGGTASAADASFGSGGATATDGSLGSGGAMATDASFGTGGTVTATGGNAGTTITLGTGGAPGDAQPADSRTQLGDASYPLIDGSDMLAVIDPEYVRNHFEELVSGTWLVGWYGGYDHFSWVRITMPSGSPFDGELTVIAEPSIPAGVPYWDCSGSASWMVTQAPRTLDLRLEALGCAREIIVFDTFRPVTRPGKAFLEARISAAKVVDGGYSSNIALTGLKFRDDVCDAAFTSCDAGF